MYFFIKRVTVNFSVRLVPNQTAEETFQILENHIKQIWHENGNVNFYNFKMNFGYDPWKENPSSPHYRAAAEAIKTVQIWNSFTTNFPLYFYYFIYFHNIFFLLINSELFF